MGLEGTSEFAQVANTGYVVGVVSVTTSITELKASGSRLNDRKAVRVYNNSNTTIYFGPSGVTASTGEPLVKGQSATIAIGEDLGLYAITASGTASDVRVQELS